MAAALTDVGIVLGGAVALTTWYVFVAWVMRRTI